MGCWVKSVCRRPVGRAVLAFASAKGVKASAKLQQRGHYAERESGSLRVCAFTCVSFSHFPMRPSPHTPCPEGAENPEKWSHFLSSNMQKWLTPVWKAEKNVLSLCMEKRGYATVAHPRFRVVEYQPLTESESVHPRAPGCTSGSYSPYSRRSGAYPCRKKVLCSASGVFFALGEDGRCR